MSHPIRYLYQESEADANYKKNKESAKQEQENSPSVLKHKETFFSRWAIRVGCECDDGVQITAYRDKDVDNTCSNNAGRAESKC